MKWHAKVDIGESRQTTASNEGIYYLNANILYYGVMYRMMPYELVGVSERQEVMERINRNSIKWVKSLNTFDKDRFFIKCDIETPTQLHDKINNLPFILFGTEGRYVFKWNQEIC